jgi:hypothetical protein
MCSIAATAILASPLSAEVLALFFTPFLLISATISIAAAAIAIGGAPLTAKVYVSVFNLFLPIDATNFNVAASGFSAQLLNRSILFAPLNVNTGKIITFTTIGYIH